jgi:putative nucleotidyltransferase with HDIG domain
VITPARVLCLASSLVFAATCVGAVLLADSGSWHPVVLGLLIVLVVGANLVEIEYKRIAISGDLLAIVIAMALLGPAQAALLGVISSLVFVSRAPTRTAMALLGLAEHAALGLVGGIVVREVGTLLSVTPDSFSFSVAVVAGTITAFLVNVVMQFAGLRLLDGTPFWGSIRAVVAPVLPSELAMALLASIIVYAEAHAGPLALAMLVALFFLYLHLLRELVRSQHRGDELTHRTEQLASLQVGVLTAMLRTLSMRDRMTARHSAAVARYARELAAAYGCSQEEQDLVHTAGLLHDIGKFILPDHILLADTKLSDEDWGLIKMHPYQGAKVVREMEGYGPVADIILCHHERIDGKGYPRGVAGDAIPIYSRMISIADTYDVMTSRDSYRDTVSSDAAIIELRRVSGAQLDGNLVELFVQVLESKGVAFRHADDADFEAELQFDRRMREHAAPRALVAVA